MVVKFGMQQQRGAAGESAMVPRRGLNFANLYAQNRADGEINQKANSMQQGVNQAQQMGMDAKNMATGRQDKAGDATGGQTLMASAVEKAKGISNQAQGYNPAAEMTKAGANPYQASVGSFYSGGKNSAGAQRIRQFGGIFGQMLSQQSDMNNSLNRGMANSIVTTPGKVGDGKSAYQQNLDQMAEQNAGTYDMQQKPGERRVGNQNDLNHLDNLTWMLKTGRISYEDKIRAEKDPAYYDLLMKKGQ